MYDTLTKASLVCRCWCSSRVMSAAYGGHFMSKTPRAIRQGINVVSCAEYKNSFLLEREDVNRGTRAGRTQTAMCVTGCVGPEVSNLFGSDEVPCTFLVQVG